MKNHILLTMNSNTEYKLFLGVFKNNILKYENSFNEI